MNQVAAGRISQPGRFRTECDIPQGFCEGGGGRLGKRITSDNERYSFGGIQEESEQPQDEAASSG